MINHIFGQHCYASDLFVVPLVSESVALLLLRSLLPFALIHSAQSKLKRSRASAFPSALLALAPVYFPHQITPRNPNSSEALH